MVSAHRPILWRRIVVWSTIRIGTAQPVVGTDSASGHDYLKRNITPITQNEELREFLFKGTLGSDYTQSSIFEAGLNRSHYTVSYDKTRVINPSHTYPDTIAGQIVYNKFWNPGGKVVYDEDEQGSDTKDSSGWSVYASPSRGNMYIIDVFGDGGSRSGSGDVTDIGRFRPVGVSYWREP